MTFNILNIANSFPTTFSLSLTLSSFHQPNMNSFSSKKICELYYLNKIQAGGPTNLSLEHGALKSNGHWWEPAPHSSSSMRRQGLVEIGERQTCGVLL